MTPEVAAWVTAHRERLELFDLPRYAPELNADEYLNNDLKGAVNAAGLPHNRGEVRSRIQRFMRKLLHLPEHVMSYFQRNCLAGLFTICTLFRTILVAEKRLDFRRCRVHWSTGM
jgi:hypothetical protein